MNPTYRLIEGSYLSDLQRQPDALWETTQALLDQRLKDLPGRWQHGSFDRVILTGMGSSYHALHAIAPILARTGVPTLQLETSELLHHQFRQLDPRALLVVASQSGRSAEVLRLLDAVPSSGSLLAVTNEADSPLARRAGIPILTAAGEESGVACKTYLATVAGLLWCAEVLLGASPTATADTIGAAADAVADYLSWWRDHVEQLADELSEARLVLVAGRGASLAAAGAAGLVIKEAARFPAEGLSSAALRHGPLEICGPETAVFVLEGSDPTADLNQRLVQTLADRGGKAWIVGKSAKLAALKLPTLKTSLLPLVEMLPLQMASVALAALAGIEAGKFERATKVTNVE